jgi:hypothetical protein
LAQRLPGNFTFYGRELKPTARVAVVLKAADKITTRKFLNPPEQKR